MSPALWFEGHAIVSADGMIAAADGSMPPALRSDADWRSFQAALDRSALVVLGRKGHERHPNPGRRRLVLTGSVATLAADPVDRLATLWNPAGIAVGDMLERLKITEGVIAITGGMATFDLFLPHYSSFVLAEVSGLTLPGGIPCFSTGRPAEALERAGLRKSGAQEIDPGVVQTVWRRL
jgi:hypothetical protein